MAEVRPEVRQAGWLRGDPPETLVTDEWLVTNGLGGYAAGTVGGPCSRRFHGLLIASLRAPLGRTMMFNHLEETLEGPDGLPSTVTSGLRCSCAKRGSAAATIAIGIKAARRLAGCMSLFRL